MGPEFNEKMQWARYLQMQHDEERRQERARMARIEEELKKEKENKDVEEKYMNYEVEEKTEEKAEETEDNISLELLGRILGAILSTVLSILFFGGLIIGLFWILGTLVGG